MIIKRFGTDLRSKTAESILSKALEGEEGRLFLFPIPSAPDGLRVKGSDSPIGEELGRLTERDVAAGYAFPEPTAEKEFPYRKIDVMQDGIFTEENARLTALGALGVILTEQKRAVKDLKVGVIGYGRIGKELVRLLLFHGAEVCVYSENTEKREELCSYGISCKESVVKRPCGRFSGIDVLFNTAPAPLILSEEAEELKNCAVYELASGDQLPDTVAYERLSSLPEKMYPVSAGKVYAEAVLRLLRGE